VRPFAGIPELLETLRASGCRCLILSSNAGSNIARFLIRHELTSFEHVTGGTTIFGKGRALKRVMRERGLDAGSTSYVGDEVRDVHAAAQAGIRSIAVSWGYGLREALAARAPDHIVDRPEELLSVLVPRH
jgi:phosphoglycolate phosphatase-like HAD superfamily hydrolase